MVASSWWELAASPADSRPELPNLRLVELAFVACAQAMRRACRPGLRGRRQQRLRPEVLRRPHLRYEPLVPARQAQAEAAEAIEKGVGHGGAHRARHEQAARSDVRRVKVDLPHVDKLERRSTLLVQRAPPFMGH